MVEKNTKVEELPRKILSFFVVIIVLFAIGVIGFMVVKNISFMDALVMTIQSMAFMFTAETGIAKALQIFLALFGVMVLGWILSNVLNIIFEGRISEYLKTSKFSSELKKMRNHHIIAGGGRVGEEIAQHLRDNKKVYIIIEKDGAKVENLRRKGHKVLVGDVTEADSSDLIKAGIKNAKTIVLAMPETEKNLLMTMISKDLNPKIEVYARADNPAFVDKLKKAGAKVVIVPELAAAEKFLKELG